MGWRRGPDVISACAVSDAQRRGLRSLLQVGFVQALIALYNAFAVVDLTTEQVTAITLVATPLLAFAQNWIEDNTQFPAFGKAPASSGENPVPGDGGHP
jgi:hypothetical protein